MIEAIEFLLKLAQEKLQNFKGRSAMKAIEALLDTQCRVKSLKNLPSPVMQYRKPEQLYLWQKDRV